MCLTPITLKQTKATTSDFHTREVPCGLCPQCLQRRQRSWQFRLEQELKRSISATFLTLTYEHEPLNQFLQPTLVKDDLQRFFKRLRKKTKNKIKYYACGEYGETTKRPHYHAIMFNIPHNILHHPNTLYDIWGSGHIYTGECNANTISYVTKYIMKGAWKPSVNDQRQKEFSLMSKNMGLNYLTPQTIKHHQEHLKSYITLPGNIKTAMPRYYRDKIFTLEQKHLINKATQEALQFNIEKLFNNDHKHHIEWKLNKFRKAKRIQNLERIKL